MSDTNLDQLSLGKRIRKARNEKKLTIEEVAKSIGVPASTYRDWENGRSVTGEPYQKIALALGMSVYEILGIEDCEKDYLLKQLHQIELLIKEMKLKL